jgi:hypothetical protein
MQGMQSQLTLMD